MCRNSGAMCFSIYVENDQCPTVSKKLVCFLRIPIFVFLVGLRTEKLYVEQQSVRWWDWRIWMDPGEVNEWLPTTIKNSTSTRQTWWRSSPPFIMDGRHPERPPQREAQPISSADSGESSVAARWSWAAPGLSSGRFVVAAAALGILWIRTISLKMSSNSLFRSIKEEVWWGHTGRVGIRAWEGYRRLMQ